MRNLIASWVGLLSFLVLVWLASTVRGVASSTPNGSRGSRHSGRSTSSSTI
jgi:hypothetical protein